MEGYFGSRSIMQKVMKFLEKKDADEWSYPKAFLASDGSVVGISYNKL